ncbi:tRNA-dihydrouridine synthase A [Marinicellulosiphila megalodicopiae]
MVTTGALIHADAHRFLKYHEAEHPIALQLGGSDPSELAHCAKLGEKYGYDEINLNIGCPSDRVQNGMIGAILMGHKQIVADAVKQMKDASDVPVVVKHRIGIDDFDSEAFLFDFVDHVAKAGCDTFVVHARKAILQGLSPKENREVPPLNYQRVYDLKKEFSNLNIIINGGIETTEQCHEHLKYCDGVMLGRKAYHDPRLLMQVDHEFYGDSEPDVDQIVRDAIAQVKQYIQSEEIPIKYITRHMLGLFSSVKGAKQYRRHLSEYAPQCGNRIDVLCDALRFVGY